MLEADLPGLNEKDIKLEVRNGQLTFSTSKNEKSEEKSKKDRWIRKERREFQFVRSFTLPEDVDANGIEAHFKNGVLQVVMPKKPEALRKRSKSRSPKHLVVTTRRTGSRARFFL